MQVNSFKWACEFFSKLHSNFPIFHWENAIVNIKDIMKKLSGLDSLDQSSLIDAKKIGNGNKTTYTVTKEYNGKKFEEELTFLNDDNNLVVVQIFRDEDRFILNFCISTDKGEIIKEFRTVQVFQTNEKGERTFYREDKTVNKLSNGDYLVTESNNDLRKNSYYNGESAIDIDDFSYSILLKNAIDYRSVSMLFVMHFIDLLPILDNYEGHLINGNTNDTIIALE